MEHKEFLNEYISEYTNNNEEYLKAYELWIDYSYKCERHDQFVCTGPKDEYGFIKPASSEEHRAINNNARVLTNYLISNAKLYGLTDEVLSNAKKDVNRLSCEGLEREYRRINNETT